MAYVVSLHFMLPGTMSVLSLVDSGGFFWRLVFALAGVAGIVGALMISSSITTEFGQRRLAGRDAVGRASRSTRWWSSSRSSRTRPRS